MLTITKPVQYGYGPVHDLPTPPSTSRPSPPLIYKDSSYKSTLTNPRDSSPLHQPMSAPHRGLPPPAALPPVQPPPGSGLSQPPVSGPPPPPPQQNQSYTQLPLPPSWHGNEESMQYWLKAKAEEDKRKQEEEKTRQESFRLEQRKMEHEILRTSLHGGIPPPLVPVVFAGMGGGALSPQAWELAQQFLPPHQQQHPPALMPSGAIASEHQRRDSQAQGYGQYPTSGGVPSTPGSAQGPTSSYMTGYPGSPTRPRGQSMPGRPPSNLPNLNTNLPGGPGGGPATASHPGIAHSQHQDAQPSPSIYFHHWQPPTTQAGGTRSGTDQPGTPSVGESPRKRKAAGPQPPIPPPSTAQRLRSPPFQHSAALSNPPPGRRRGHSRQRSDLGSYRAGGRGLRGESSGPGREMSPMHTSGASSARESEPSSSSQAQQGQQLHRAPPPQPAPMRTGAHSVSSLLSDTPQSPQPPTHQFAVSSEPRQFGQQQQQQQQQQHHHHHHQQTPHQTIYHQQQAYGESERTLEEKLRGGGVPGSSTTRQGDND
ncbi:Putative protein of unknown function [Podospora comata]|uniref:Uncharacterized protein n=1 Tax=Podospora comata TaxID=48703 RepID=A0ABY6S7V1_PODCO|nr:Putative protein of unknown function [Podospora comata]